MSHLLVEILSASLQIPEVHCFSPACLFSLSNSGIGLIYAPIQGGLLIPSSSSSSSGEQQQQSSV